MACVHTCELPVEAAVALRHCWLSHLLQKIKAQMLPASLAFENQAKEEHTCLPEKNKQPIPKQTNFIRNTQ